MIKEFSLFDLGNNSRKITKNRNPEIHNNKINSSIALSYLLEPNHLLMNNISRLSIFGDNNINDYTKNRGDISNFGNRNRALTSSNNVNDFIKINDYSSLKDSKTINTKYCANNNFLEKKVMNPTKILN